MKSINIFLFACVMFIMSGCEAIGDIFSAGFYSGLAVVVLIAIVIVWLVARRRN